MLKIEINGVNDVIKAFKPYKNFEKKVYLLMDRLFEIGFKEATVRFDSAVYDGENDVTVIEPHWENDTLVLEAEGKAVTFIEFGTGITFEDHPLQQNIPGIVPHGQYGDKQGGNPKGWTYEGVQGSNPSTGEFVRESKRGTIVRTWGNPPARAMYIAGMSMQMEIYRLVKEIFS